MCRDMNCDDITRFLKPFVTGSEDLADIVRSLGSKQNVPTIDYCVRQLSFGMLLRVYLHECELEIQ